MSLTEDIFSNCRKCSVMVYDTQDGSIVTINSLERLAFKFETTSLPVMI